MTKELEVMKGKKLPKLTRKQAKFVEVLVSNPKASATEAAVQAYNVKSRLVGRTIAGENMTKPNILQHLVANSERAEQKIVDLMEAEKDEVKLAAAKDILDRVHGKATQKIEQSSTGVTLNIDLTGLSGPTDEQ